MQGRTTIAMSDKSPGHGEYEVEAKTLMQVIVDPVWPSKCCHSGFTGRPRFVLSDPKADDYVPGA